MAVVRREQFAELLAPGLRKIFFDEFRARPEEYSQVANVSNSTRAWEEEMELSGLGPTPLKPEGTRTLYDKPVPGNKVRYTHQPYGKGFRVTHEMYVDDQYGPMRKMSKLLGRSARNRMEQSFFDLFNNGFVTTFNTGFDGLALFSTAHTLLNAGGTTQANRPAVDADLGLASLRAAIDQFEKMVDHEGFPVMFTPKYLLVSTSDVWMAHSLLQSQFEPFTDQNQVNRIASLGIIPIVGHYLTDPDAWFLLAEKGEHDLKFIWREKLTFDEGDDFDTGDAKFKSYMRYSTGFSDYRGTYGSPGA